MREAGDIGVGRIVYTGWGEPTVHPRFMEFLEVAKELGFEVVVNTNGSRLEELAVSFVKLGVDEVYVSIDAFDIKLYSSIRRFGDLSTVTRGLLTLRKVKTGISSLKPTVKAILTVTKVNVGEISRILDYAVDTGISEIVISSYIPYVGGDLRLDCVTPSPHPRRPSLVLGLPERFVGFPLGRALLIFLSDSPCLGHHLSGPGGLGPSGTIGPPSHTGRLNYICVGRALNLFRS